MAITAEQTAAILAELSVDLTTVTDDRLIELCLLYRSAPEALPTFPDLLEAEITRRFTAAEIAANDVMFSVIQNFSNQFNPELKYKEKMYEFVNALDRELWITQNITFFEQLLETTDRMSWVVNNNDVMTALSLSDTAITRIAVSNIAMTEIASSSVAMTAVIASNTAMTAVIASNTAMTAVAASSVALSAIVKSTAARNALMSSNAILQESRVAIYNTVKASWSKQTGISDSRAANNVMTTINTAVASPTGFVFASLGLISSGTGALSNITHPDGKLAAAMGTSTNPTTLTNLDAVSFNGATFKATIDGAAAYAELWIPPA